MNIPHWPKCPDPANCTNKDHEPLMFRCPQCKHLAYPKDGETITIEGTPTYKKLLCAKCSYEFGTFDIDDKKNFNFVMDDWT